MDSPPSSQTDDEPIAAEPPGRDPQREFLRLALGHARWFARWFGAEGEQASRWLDAGLSRYPLALARVMPARAAQLFWRALLGAELPGTGRMPLEPEPHAVEELLAQLDPAARAAFVLRVWHDFDDELLADLLGLRVGQVRVGLMRAFGLMRARLGDAGDSSGDAAQWVRLIRARLATLTARVDAGDEAADTRRLARLFGDADADADADADDAGAERELLDAAATLRETSLASAVTLDGASDGEMASAAAAEMAPPAPPRRQPRSRPVWRWGLAAAALALVAVLAWWAGSPADPPEAGATREPTATPARPTPVPAVAAAPTRDIEAVLASPDLPLLDGRLTPSQLAVMDQLRWWASTQPLQPGVDATTAATSPQPQPIDEVPASFEQLPATDRRLLQGFSALWPRLGDEQRLTLLDNARRWQTMGSAARERVVQRSLSFGELPAQTRARARDSFALWQTLPPTEQDALLAAFAAFSRLSPQQQREVADGFARLSPSEQARWRFAEGERELLGLAGRVFSFVPEAERTATLALLQSLDEADRDRLRQGTRRMSAWQREQLRKSLLAEPEASRSDWLRRRFGG